MPAVVGTGTATTRIRTGQRVRVDGDRGVVTGPRLTGAAMTSTRPVLRLRRRRARATSPAVGGKGASLGELLRAGHPRAARLRGDDGGVPAAIDAARPRTARHRARRVAGASTWPTIAPLAAATARVRGGRRAAPLPRRGRRRGDRELRGAVRRVRRAELPVAVRSSATSEDSAEASFAGLQDTYLWVRGADAVLDQVRALLGEPVQRRVGRPTGAARASRRRPGDGRRRPADGRARSSAGVMFTRSPVTGDRSVVAIERSWGLGSAVVGGEVTPDYLRGQQGDRRDHRARSAAKTRGHRPIRRTVTGMVATPMAVPTAADRRRLTDEEIARAGRDRPHGRGRTTARPRTSSGRLAAADGGRVPAAEPAGDGVGGEGREPRTAPRPPRGRSTTCSTCSAASARRRADGDGADAGRRPRRPARPGLQRPRRAAPGARRPDAHRAPRGRGRAGRRSSRSLRAPVLEPAAAPVAAAASRAGPAPSVGRGAGRRAPAAAGHLLPRARSRAHRRSSTSATRSTEETVVGIIEIMKMMTPVHAGVRGHGGRVPRRQRGVRRGRRRRCCVVGRRRMSADPPAADRQPRARSPPG